MGVDQAFLTTMTYQQAIMTSAKLMDVFMPDRSRPPTQYDSVFIIFISLPAAIKIP